MAISFPDLWERGCNNYNGDLSRKSLMLETVPIVLVALASYLIGGIPFGYLIARARGVDLFKEGSGNIGATNAGRVLGAKFGFLVFFLDFAKGAGPVLLARLLAPSLVGILNSEELGVVAGLAAFLGHLFPVYLGFRGGKGVATGTGVVAILLPVATVFGLLVWVGLVGAARYVSVASMCAGVTLCLVRIVRTPAPFARENLVLTSFCLAAAVLIVVRHHSNIRNLCRGSEGQLKETPTMQSLLKILHVFAIGLWFGMAIFFSFVVGLSLFGAAGDLVKADAKQTAWFEVPAQFKKAEGTINGTYEYGSRTAGHLISPMFDWYFLLQGICGFLGAATAWGWQFREPKRRVHRMRITILLVAIATVVIGWRLEVHVSHLRDVRHQKMDAYFSAKTADIDTAQTEALAAKSAFGLWHTISLFLNFATIGLVTAGMAMAAFLPVGAVNKQSQKDKTTQEPEPNSE